MKILFISSEMSPFAKVGGLADVAGSLPKNIKKEKVDISVIIPLYGIIKNIKTKTVYKNEKIKFENKDVFFDILKLEDEKDNINIYFIKNEEYFKGGVYIEEDASSGGSKKEAERFLFFSKVSLEIAKKMKIDVLHCNDWHTGIIPYLVKKEKLNIKTLITIHNIAYQGIYSKNIVNSCLDTNFTKDVNCLKEGVINADFVNTVSENYAKEILTKEFGFGLEQELKKKKNNLVGVLNGIDIDEFNPQKDKFIKHNYSLKDIKIKEKNKSFLQKTLFKEQKPSIPIFGMITRMAEQKGFDILKEIIGDLLKKDIQIILLGKGEKRYEDLFLKIAKENPQKFFIKIGFDEALARQIYAGSDFFLMPSRFEPCGLGQLIAMRYGSIPIVRETGGLKDTVIPVKKNGTGLIFKKYNSKELLKTISSAIDLYNNKKQYSKIQKNGMKKDFSWKISARKYINLYKKLFKNS